MKAFRPTIREIQNAAATHYGVSAAEMRSPTRAYRVARPRQMAMYLARELTGRSTTEIAHAFRRSDHTTILHAVRMTRSRLDEDLWLHVERQSVLHWLREMRRPVECAVTTGTDDPASVAA